MLVQGWIFVGSPPNSRLPPERFCGEVVGEALPEASSFQVGDWLNWRPGPGFSVTAVCVAIPLL